MTQYLGLPIPSPALFDKIGQKFRRPVASFAEANHIPWVKFAKDDRKADVTAQYFKRAAAHRWRRSRARECRSTRDCLRRQSRSSDSPRTKASEFGWRTRRARV